MTAAVACILGCRGGQHNWEKGRGNIPGVYMQSFIAAVLMGLKGGSMSGRRKKRRCSKCACMRRTESYLGICCVGGGVLLGTHAALASAQCSVSVSHDGQLLLSGNVV